MSILAIRPPRIALALIALSAGLHLLLKRSQSQFRCLPCAVALGLAGFGWMTWAWAKLRSTGTPIRPTDTATVLVTDGPFRYSRNPMYAGILVMLFGIAAGVETWPWLLAPAGFYLITSRWFIPFEERRLKDIFGDRYANYQKKVRRWL